MKIFYFIILLIISTNIFSQIKTESKNQILKFIKLVKQNDIEGLAEIINYPLEREYPIPPVKTKSEFIKRFDEIFDLHLRNQISASTIKDNWSEVGWRGICFDNGLIWITDGSIRAINYQTNYEKELLNKINSSQKKKLHESVKNFTKAILEIETKKYKIRIDKMPYSKFRYSAWNIDKQMSEKPNIVIQNGIVEFDGSGGNHRYIFINNEYKYEISVNALRAEEDPPATLTVYKNDVEIMNQKAINIKQ